MGTKHLIAVMVEGEYKIAQYGQWDGYPEGQGVTVLKFLRSLKTADKKTFKEKCQKCSWLSQTETKNIDEIIKEQSKSLSKDFPELSRDTGGKILEMILKSKNGFKLVNSIEFAADSLFCEWAYVIDFDKKTLEIFKGFNQTLLNKGERFATLSDPVPSKYTPVRAFLTYKLNKLPTIKEFLETAKKKET